MSSAVKKVRDRRSSQPLSSSGDSFPEPPVVLLLSRAHRASSSSLVPPSQVEPLRFPFQTPDPFLFAVYHNDDYPAGDDQLRAPRRGNGADFDPNSAYRMYHGDRVPGFPQHPHRGFETITATMIGLVDHTDSVGNAGRYGHGDVQWMTAGKGIVHGEMFPLVNADAPNPLRLFQIWLNLPARSKMADPAFVMHWGEDVATAKSADGLTTAIVWAGELLGARGGTPPLESWAADDANDVVVAFLTMKPGATFALPPARVGGDANRSAYFFEGSALRCEGETLRKGVAVELDASVGAELSVPSDASEDAMVLILQGRPIGEPVAQHGPFVMNTRSEIARAFADYERTRFGGWPWDDDAPVFGKKGRFAKVNGVEYYPPSAAAAAAKDER